MKLIVNKPYKFIFTGSGGDGHSIRKVQWDFGDGDIKEGMEVLKKYSSTGTYTLTITAINDCGAKAVKTERVEVVAEGEKPNYLPLILASVPILGVSLILSSEVLQSTES